MQRPLAGNAVLPSRPVEEGAAVKHSPLDDLQ